MPLQPMITGARHMISAGHYLAAEAGHAVLAGRRQRGRRRRRGRHRARRRAQRPGAVLRRGADGHPPGRARRDHHDRRARRLAARGAAPDASSRSTAAPSRYGVLRTVVPAAPDAWILALERYGTMSFGDVAAAAIRYAREGFTMHPVMAHFIDRYADGYRRWPANAAIWLPGGRPPREGELFVQADLARSIQFMADEERAASRAAAPPALHAARDAFYRGDLATAMVRYHRDNGGWLTADDLASYRSEIEPPAAHHVRRHGGLHVRAVVPGAGAAADALAAGRRRSESARPQHAGVRPPRHRGDEALLRRPRALLRRPALRRRADGRAAGARVRRRAAALIGERACPEMPPAGAVPGFGAARRRCLPRPQPPARAATLGGDTSYVCVVDRHGNAFSATPSDASWDGPVHSRPGLRPLDARLAVVGGAGPRSCVAPGKRPRLTPNPALARARPRWVMPFGAPGGDLQPQAMLQVLLNHTVFGMSIQEAVEAPRFVTHSFPGSSSRTRTIRAGSTSSGHRGGDGRRAGRARASGGVAARPVDRHRGGVRDLGRSRGRDPLRRRGPAPGGARDRVVSRGWRSNAETRRRA